MADNKIVYGLKNVHIAFRNDTAGQPSWEEPIAIPGAVNFSASPEGDENVFYADDGPYFRAVSNNGYSAELEIALIPDDVMAKMMGWEIDDNNMLVETTDALPNGFALLAQITGDAKNRKFVYYNCVADRSDSEYSTKGESLEPTTTTLPIKIMPIEIGGRNIVKGVIELDAGGTNAAVYEAFYDAVILPGASAPTVVKSALEQTIALAETFEDDVAEYTTASFTAFTNALTSAEIVVAKDPVTQKEINAADAALKAAILGLVPEPVGG